MNIFVLNNLASEAAKLHCDQHVIKMTLETAQMLCTAVRELSCGEILKEIPYKATHNNHPCTKWAMETRGNFEWLVLLGLALADEHIWRYENNKYHKSRDVILWCAQNAPDYDQFKKPNKLLTEWPQVMPDEFKDGTSTIGAYRKYYQGKDFNMTWRKRPVPHWFRPEEPRSRYEWTPNEDQKPLSNVPFEEYIKRVQP